MAGFCLYAEGSVETKIQDLVTEFEVEILACEAIALRSFSPVFSRPGSSISCMPNLDWSSVCAAANIDLKFRPMAGILAETSVRRRGLREYSVDRASLTSFFARLEVLFDVGFVSEEAEASEADEERRRRWGGD